MQITAKTTPLAIISLFIFNKTPKATKSRIAPKVINFPNFPSDFILLIPVIKSKSVKKVINRKTPKTQVKIPIIKPISMSFLVIPIPSVELLYGVMSGQIKLYRNHGNITIG